MIKAPPFPLYKYSRISGIMGGTFLRFTAFLHFFCFSSLTKTRNGCILCKQHVVAVAQLVRASGCGPEGRRFESDQPPHFFAQILGKKITKPQGFTSLREAQFHSKLKVFFTSSPNSGSLACEDAPFHSACEGVPLSLHL